MNLMSRATLTWKLESIAITNNQGHSEITIWWRLLVAARHLRHITPTRSQLQSQIEIKIVMWQLPYSNTTWVIIIPSRSLILSMVKTTSVWPHLIQQSWKININTKKMKIMDMNPLLRVNWTLWLLHTRELWMLVRGTWMVRPWFLPRRLTWRQLSDLVIKNRIQFQYIYHWRNNIMG